MVCPSLSSKILYNIVCENELDFSDQYIIIHTVGGYKGDKMNNVIYYKRIYRRLENKRRLKLLRKPKEWRIYLKLSEWVEYEKAIK